MLIKQFYLLAKIFYINTKILELRSQFQELISGGKVEMRAWGGGKFFENQWLGAFTWDPRVHIQLFIWPLLNLAISAYLSPTHQTQNIVKTLWLGSNVVAPIHKAVVTLTSQRQNYVALTLSQHWIVSLKSQRQIWIISQEKSFWGV